MFLLTTAFLVTAPAFQSPQVENCVTVQLTKAEIGGPIANAPVKILGHDEMVVSGEDGIAFFRGIPQALFDQGELKVFSTPSGFAPVCRIVDVDNHHPLVYLQVPNRKEFATGIIDSASGGSFSFTGFMGHGQEPFQLTVDVPENVYSQDIQIELGWYGVQSGYFGEIPENEVYIGGIEVRLRDDSGQLLNQKLAAGIDIGFEPMSHWSLDELGVVDVTAERFDLTQGLMAEYELTPWAYRMPETAHLLIDEPGLYRVRSNGTPLGTTSSNHVYSRAECVYRDSTIVECGNATSAAGWRGTTMNAEVYRNDRFEAQVSVATEASGSGLTRLLLDIQGEFSGSVSWSEDGGISVKATSSWGCKWAIAGDQVAPKCINGEYTQNEVITKVYVYTDSGPVAIASHVSGSFGELKNATINMSCDGCDEIFPTIPTQTNPCIYGPQ